MALTTKVLQAALNHLIAAEPWAQQQLAPHAGKLIAVRAAPLPEAWLMIGADGALAEVVPGEAAPVLTISVPAGRAIGSLGNREALEHAMDFEGDAQLEQTVRALVRALRWDAEEDLSKWVGDAAAHRIASTGRRARAWSSEGVTRAGQNIGEYLSEERRLVISRVQLATLADDIRDCDQRLAALEGRLAVFEQRLRGAV